jgi:hypothetical protein
MKFLNERMMKNVQNCDSYINVPSSQMYSSYILRMFENRVLRGIFGLKRDEVG